MSAFMVSKKHIDLLVRTAYAGPTTNGKQGGYGQQPWYRPYFKGESQWQVEQCDAIGEMLIKENLSSIHARYPDTITDPESTPGPVDQYWLEPYTLADPFFAKRLTAIEALKALDCYEYQSCEHPEWEQSEAHEFCERFRHALIGCLDGYEDAPWEWYEKTTA